MFSILHNQIFRLWKNGYSVYYTSRYLNYEHTDIQHFAKSDFQIMRNRYSLIYKDGYSGYAKTDIQYFTQPDIQIMEKWIFSTLHNQIFRLWKNKYSVFYTTRYLDYGNMRYSVFHKVRYSDYVKRISGWISHKTEYPVVRCI